MNRDDDEFASLMRFFKGKTFTKVEKVQALWSGYGEIARYASAVINDEGIASCCIAKIVSLEAQNTHPRGWNNMASHQRKISSYVNERHFYKYLAPFTHEQCKVPVLFDHGANENKMWMLMQDLDAAGFSGRSAHANMNLVRLAIKWLANFHACFMHDTSKQLNSHTDCPQPNDSDAYDNNNLRRSKTWHQYADKVWPVGTYWHLATRKQEWQGMPNSELKRHAFELDKYLNNARFQTLLHGDAKIANFCIHTSETKIAAVDFQYTGFGVGVKDIVYLLGSCLHSDELELHSDTLLGEYFSALKKALLNNAHNNKIASLDLALIEDEYRRLYAFAWADFERFLSGWSPDHPKLHQYSSTQTNIALAQLPPL